MRSYLSCSNSTGLWYYLSQLTQTEETGRLWPAILQDLLLETEAVGAWIKLPAPFSLDLTAGELDDSAREAIGEWTKARAAAPGTGNTSELLHVASGLLLCAPVAGNHAPDEAFLVIRFSPTQSLSTAAETQFGSMLNVIAAIARQAIELRQTHEKLNRVRHLYEVGQAIASTLELDQVLEQSTIRVAETLRAEASTLMLVDENRGELVFKIPAGPAEHILREQRMPMDKGVAGWAATHGIPVIIPDVAADDRFYTGIDRMTGYQTRSIMAVPLQVKGRTIGVVEVINKTDGAHFTPDDQQWLSILAPLIAVAVENARLFTALREERDRIIAAEEQVRHEMARYLHDGPAQILAAIILNIDMARRHLASGPEKMATELNYIDSLAQEANQEIRDLLFNLRPITLETHGLTAALAQLAERIQQHCCYKLHLDVGNFDDAIDTRIAGTLFVIVQEALNNVQKHAHAQNVWVRLGATDTNFWVEVADDGSGFDVRQVEADYGQRNSFGLLNMRERARLIDGHTAIHSPRPNGEGGTLVRVEVPRERAQRQG